MKEDITSQHDEQLRVKEIIQLIIEKEKMLTDKSSGLKQRVMELRKNFWKDVTVNFDEPDDIIETEASIKQQAELLSERERTHGKIGEELKTLNRLKDTPYFGRIDFHEDGDPDTNPIYIGSASLMDHESENFLIYDWRAPISSMYYDYSPGKAVYKTMDGQISGSITLKRQFIIRQGFIKGMFDTGVTIGDSLLQHALGNNASTTMKSIVATIQREQNRIIRNEQSNVLIVQGVAGSGKTSAALQRIAYLMYRHREELTADNMMLLSPNPLFSSYIANVLPELGETNVKQTTFYNFLRERINKRITMESPFDQMEYILMKNETDACQTRMKGMNFKSSLSFQSLLDHFIDSLQNDGIAFRNIVFRKQILIPKSKIKQYFYELDPHIAIPNKLELVSNWLLKRLQKIQSQEKDKDWVMEQIQLMDKEDYLDAYKKAEDMDERNNMDGSNAEEEILRKAVVNRFFKQIKRRVKQLDFVHVFATYKKIFQMEHHTCPADWAKISKQTSTHLKERFLPWEDAASYLYIKEGLLGYQSDRSVRHLFIDEAQDYSAFQFALIQHLFPHTRMTLLGDINQAIYVNTTKENPLTAANKEISHERIVLTTSYRSTKPIVEFTKCFAPGGDWIEPFNREGNKPRLIPHEKGEQTKILLAITDTLKDKGYETIAIICKTAEESEKVSNALQDKIQLKQMNEETYSFEKGLLVLPVYLAKGIEFDAVIIPDASNHRYGNEADRTLFYTACTRAMHELVMIHTAGEPSIFIKEADAETYHTAKTY